MGLESIPQNARGQGSADISISAIYHHQQHQDEKSCHYAVLCRSTLLYMAVVSVLSIKTSSLSLVSLPFPFRHKINVNVTLQNACPRLFIYVFLPAFVGHSLPCPSSCRDCYHSIPGCFCKCFCGSCHLARARRSRSGNTVRSTKALRLCYHTTVMQSSI